MYVNGEMVGRSLIAVTENKGGTTKFNPINTFKINGKEPPVIIFWNIQILEDLTFFLMSGSCHLDRALNDKYSVECLF